KDKNNNIQWLIKNNIPSWCVQLLALNYNNGNLNKNEVSIALTNLILNGKTDLFNSYASKFNFKPINFNSRVNNFKDKSQFDFVEAYRIYSLAHKNPSGGYNDLRNAKISPLTRNILGTYVAMQFALKHDFNMALNLYDKYDHDYLSNDELEWKVRSYMFASNWSDVIDTIEDMPDNLKSKNIWLYWQGKANAYLGEKSKANDYYKKIPNDYSYYSMLASSELGNNTEYLTNNSKSTYLKPSIATNNAKLALDLYLVGKSNNSKNIMNIATAEWNYASKLGSDNERLAMSNLALKNNLYDLAIFAANQLHNRYMMLSFPTPFSKSFERYANENGIDAAYALAVARQESRFNAKVIAFDGGVGLMQLMPQTAKYIARKSRSSNCYRLSAECNIKFGTWYLGTLASLFNQDLIYATAAYNAGPGRAKRWQDTLGKLDNVVEIELIPIQITRDYVQKVLSNKAIYDAQFANTSSINLIPFIEKISQAHYTNTVDDNASDTGKVVN
ncbi:MAG: transglycosylase SLT domain-containing protein, partial [Burkholderiales bacterium]|nr:transglycosylase SLT domain-containing protein [Burkholderiales bacterium]